MTRPSNFRALERRFANVVPRERGFLIDYLGEHEPRVLRVTVFRVMPGELEVSLHVAEFDRALAWVGELLAAADSGGALPVFPLAERPCRLHVGCRHPEYVWTVAAGEVADAVLAERELARRSRLGRVRA